MNYGHVWGMHLKQVGEGGKSAKLMEEAPLGSLEEEDPCWLWAASLRAWNSPDGWEAKAGQAKAPRRLTGKWQTARISHICACRLGGVTGEGSVKRILGEGVTVAPIKASFPKWILAWFHARTTQKECQKF